jgi:hypothetical protein
MLVKKLTLAAFLAVVALAGCHSAPYRESAYGSPEAYGEVATEKRFVDRHPLLSAPRNYYRDSGDNPVVKVLAGTFVGIPVGVAQELWQVGYGQ